jgi:hypothetical protein
MNCKNKIFSVVLALSLVIFCLQAFGEESISTTLMRSTFKIQGNSGSGVPVTGTVFIMGKPFSTNSASYVLLTATNVLNDIKSDQATLFLRIQKGDGFEKLPFQINIRTNGQPLWMKHSNADISIMNIALPSNADIHLISTDLLAKDENLKEFEIHPGQELLVLGFPLGAESNDAGFPIMRSGRIASYPLTPTLQTKTFLLDFQVFPGNSGGPVLLLQDNPTYAGGTHVGSTIQMVMGVVSQEMSMNEHVSSLDEDSTIKHKLALGVIVHASFIRDLIAQLLPP